MRAFKRENTSHSNALTGALQTFTTPMNPDSLLIELADEISTCPKCRLAETRTKTVPGAGTSSAQIMFIGEGPGEQEDLSGEPFVGKSGQLLTRELEKIGIFRDDIFITNIVKCRPPQNRTPLTDEIAACNDWLGAQIAQLLLIETESSIDPSLNHGVAGLTDFLAVYYLYNRLSPNLDAPQIRALVQSASNSMSDSLEKSLNHLCTMFFGDSVLTAGKTATGNREQLYAKLKALAESEPTALPEKFFDGVRHKTAQKFSPDVSASCKRARSCKKFTINSIAACARKQGANSRLDHRRRIVKITYWSAAA